MFETHRNFEILLPGVFGGDEDTQAWDRVSTRLNTLWLYVICLPADKEMLQLQQILFISDTMDLLDLQKDSSVTIYAAYVISPDHLNGSDSWKMNLLDHVLVGIEPHPGAEQHAYIYVLKSGQRLVDSVLSTIEGDFKNTRLLCRI